MSKHYAKYIVGRGLELPPTLSLEGATAMIFIDNKYTRKYYQIIDRAKFRNLSKNLYTEKHHIIPKSLNGSNDKDNLIILTAKEHFICHLLLTKMVEGNYKRLMSYALWGMVNQNNNNQKRITGKSYEYAKKLMQESLSYERKGKTLIELHGEEKANQIREKFKDRKTRASPNQNEILEISNRIKDLHTKNPWKRHFQYKQLEKISCPVCNKTMDPGNFSKYKHGNNCLRKSCK